MSYSIELAKEQKAGFEFQSKITGESVQEMLQRIINETGISYYGNMKQAKVDEVIEKMAASPESYDKVLAAIAISDVEIAIKR
jgi:hypothetical protein